MAKKKVKTLGASNDNGVPKAELILAKLIQNAKARGLKGTTGAYYRDKKGRKLGFDPPENELAACCAAGAGYLNPQVFDPGDFIGSIILGNDKGKTDTDLNLVGACFRDALR